MKIKLIGLGQCGSFVVYDVIAFLFGQKPSKEIKAAPQTHWRRDVSIAISRATSGGARVKMMIDRYFGGQKTPDIPNFFVIDGNRKNAVVDGLQGEEIGKKLSPLQIFVRSISLSKRNSGCNLGQVGEYVFHQEKDLEKKLKFDAPVEINALVFAGGGGSGSGGAAVLNEARRYEESLLINMMVLPPYHISDRRQMWNTGRCIMRLADLEKQTALLLFSNLSESSTAQFQVNQYISKFIVRLANFGYTGNVPKVATDIDRKDLQAFFSGKPAFIGMSSLDDNEPNEEKIAQMIKQALSVRKNQDTDGLSIEIPEAEEPELFRKIKRVMVVIGLSPRYKEEVDIVDIVKRKVAERLGTDLSELDCRAYSYTSPNDIELTIFFRHNNYRSNFLLNHFLDSYLKWYNNEQTELEYIKSKVVVGKDNDFLEDVLKMLEHEAGDNIQSSFRSKIGKIK